MRLKIVGIGPHPEVIGSEERPGVTSYFSGADTKQWHTRILLQFLPYPRRETLRKPIIVASFWRVEWIVKSTVTSRRLLLAIALGPSPLRTVLRAVRKASHSQEYAFRRERHYSGSFATFPPRSGIVPQADNLAARSGGICGVAYLSRLLFGGTSAFSALYTCPSQIGLLPCSPHAAEARLPRRRVSARRRAASRWCSLPSRER